MIFGFWSSIMKLCWLAIFAVLCYPAFVSACPFCPSAGQTLLGEVNQAHLIVFGKLSNAKRDPNDFGKGTTDMEIEVVVKDHEFLKGKKKITLPRYVPVDEKTKYLVFCEIYKGELDPYRGEPVEVKSTIAEYLKGAIAVREKDVPTKLSYFFKHFDAADWTVSADAFQEFSNSDYVDVRKAAVKMDANHLMKMLKDPNTSAGRYGLYGMLLGHCGNLKDHGQQLREFIDNPKIKQATGLDGLLAGYTMLDPKGGLEYVQSLIKDKQEEFLVRYAALRCMRFFWEYRTDVLDKKAVVASVLPLLDQQDIADIAIDDLRKWEQWEYTTKILALFDRPTHDIPIVQRSIIKYALQAPANDNNKAATEFLKRMRADEKQAERVKDLEALLELEKPRPPEPKVETKIDPKVETKKP
jgi:hypothetical protein